MPGSGSRRERQEEHSCRVNSSPHDCVFEPMLLSNWGIYGRLNYQNNIKAKHKSEENAQQIGRLENMKVSINHTSV